MKYVVDMRETANGALDDDNLKGERRWERHVVSALLGAGRQVASSHANWTRPSTPLWQGVTDDFSGAALITEADPDHVRYRGRPDAFVSNAFSVMTPSAEAEIRHAIADLGRRRVVLTHSFQAHVPQKRLPPDLHDLIRWLPVPAVPHVHWDHDGFFNKTLLWSGRAIHLYLMPPVFKPVLDLLDWIRGCLQEDHGLTFEILLGEERVDQTTADNWVWRFPAFEQAFRDLRDRVVVHTSRSWREVQEVYARTKLCVNAGMMFGGPPIEAASFGIPVAGTASVSVFHTADAAAAEPSLTALPAFPEYVAADSGAEVAGTVSVSVFRAAVAGFSNNRRLVDHLDAWHRNAAEYHRVGDAYRKFVDATYTYASFVHHLDALPVFA